MFISPISTTNYNKSFIKPQQNMCFKAHPEFYRLAQNFNVTASSYFRRGTLYGAPSAKFADIVDVLKLFFKRGIFKKKIKEPIKMLIVGVASSQEPFSNLAVIKSFIGKKQLSDVLDLHIIDLQSKPSNKKLFNNSYYDGLNDIDYAESSFIEDPKVFTSFGFPLQRKYRVNDEIYNYLKSVYANRDKSMWDTRVQDGIKDIDDGSFDIISINNTLGYIQDTDERVDVLKDVFRSLKKGGVFITDLHYKASEIGGENNYNQIKEGIFRKRK